MSEHANVYVQGLPEGINDTSFRQLFEGYGTVLSAKLVADKRYGFVKYGTTAEAQAVIEAMNGFEFNGTKLTLRFAMNDQGQGKGGSGDAGFGDGGLGVAATGSTWHQGVGSGAPAGEVTTPGDNLYIKGLPPGTSDTMVKEIFGAYGSVNSVRIVFDTALSPSQGGEPQTCVLVKMEAVEQATWLVDNLNGNIPQGLVNPVSVKYASSGNKGKGKGKDMNKGGAAPRYSPYGAAPIQIQLPGTAFIDAGASKGAAGFPVDGDQSNLYVKDLPPTCDELYLYKVFAPFGAIQSVAPMMDPATGVCSGIGFVKYGTSEDAQKAMLGVSGQMLPDGSCLTVSVKLPKRQLQLEGYPAAAAPAPPPMFAWPADAAMNVF